MQKYYQMTSYPHLHKQFPYVFVFLISIGVICVRTDNNCANFIIDNARNVQEVKIYFCFLHTHNTKSDRFFSNKIQSHKNIKTNQQSFFAFTTRTPIYAQYLFQLESEELTTHMITTMMMLSHLSSSLWQRYWTPERAQRPQGGGIREGVGCEIRYDQY